MDVREKSATLTLFVGFGACAEAAALTLIRRRAKRSAMLVLAETDEQSARAESLGLPVELASPFTPLEAPAARRIIIDLANVENALFAVRSARIMAPGCVIAVRAEHPHLLNVFRDAGANDVVCPASLAALSVAETVVPSDAGPHISH